MSAKVLEEWVWKKAASLEDVQHVTRGLLRAPQEPSNLGIPCRMPKCFRVGDWHAKKAPRLHKGLSPSFPLTKTLQS